MTVAYIKSYIKRLIKRISRPVTHRWLTRKDIITGLRNMGVRPSGVLFVHSSLSAMGYVPGGARTVVSALMDYMCKDGTLVMPAHTWQFMSEGLRIFDAANQRGCVGRIAEEFRKQPGVLRSLHPTHSVAAIGPRAVFLTTDHEKCDTPCGAGTPYAKMVDLDSQILLFGLGTQYLTMFHMAEAIVNVPYAMLSEQEQFTIIDLNGKKFIIMSRRHRPGIQRRFGELATWLCEEKAAKRDFIGRVPCILIESQRFADIMSVALKRDPSFLLAR